MNYPFSINEFPLRFFIISHQTELYFSITYNHWIGDAYSISQLMAAIFTHVNGQEPNELTLQAPEMADCFRHIYRKKASYYRYVGVIQTIFRFSTAFRTHVAAVESTESGCYVHLFKKDILLQLLAIAKTHNMTINDLFVLILANLFGRITQTKRELIQSKGLKPKRNRIIIAVISNIRAQSMLPLSNVFGLFLGFFYLSFKAPEKSTFDTLSRIIHAQTKRFKHNNAAIKQHLLFKIQTSLWDRAKTIKSKYRLFIKNTPITVGISNMNLNESHPYLLNSVNQYIRCSPTAMVCPIVFNLSTINNYLSLGLSFRKACYTQEEAEYIKNAFITDIHALTLPVCNVTYILNRTHFSPMLCLKTRNRVD